MFGISFKAKDKMPSEMIMLTLADVKDGKSVFTLPWEIMVDLERRMYIDAKAHIEFSPNGNCCTEIKKDNGIVYVRESTIPRDFKYMKYDSKYYECDDYLPVRLY